MDPTIGQYLIECNRDDVSPDTHKNPRRLRSPVEVILSTDQNYYFGSYQSGGSSDELSQGATDNIQMLQKRFATPRQRASANAQTADAAEECID
jgi:hypothetical protein